MFDLDGVVRIGTEIDSSGFKKNMKNLGKTAEKSLDTTQKEIKTTEKGIDGLGDTAKSTKKDVDKFGDGLDDGAKAAKGFKNEIEKAGKSTSSFGDFLKADLIGGGIQSLVSGFMGAVEQSAEFTKSLSKLQINAETAGNSFDGIQDNFRDFVALTGQADSSAEALSNLLQTGFDDAAITQTVEALSGAVTKFPDTLNIESLADGLQETLATGEATGQFGELLDRLGIGADNFSAALANTTSEAERQQLVLDTLSGAGLNDLYEKYSEANAATLEFNQAQADLNIALSNFVSGALPLATTGLSTVADTALRLSEAFKEGGLEGFLNEAQTIVTEFANKVVEKAPELINAGFEMLQNLINGIIENQGTFFEKAPELLQKFADFITENLPTILEKGKELLLNLINGILENIPKLLESLPQIIRTITGFIADNLPTILQTGIDILLSLISGILNTIPDLVAELPAIIDAIVDGLGDMLGSIMDVGKNIVEGLWEGILGAKDWLFDKITGWGNDVIADIKGVFGIHSPSTIMRDMVGAMLVAGMAEGITSKSDDVINALVSPIEAAGQQILQKQQELDNAIGGTYEFAVDDSQLLGGMDALKGITSGLGENEEPTLNEEYFEKFNELIAEKREMYIEMARAYFEEQIELLKTEFIEKIYNILSQFPDDTYNIGIDSIQAWIDGMNEKLPSLVAKAQELARQAISAMKSELGIASPSKEGIYIGEMMNAGVAKGIDNSAPMVQKSIENMGFFDTVKAMIPQMQSAVAATMAAIAPMPAYAGGGVTRTESVQTINRNTVQTVEVVANSSRIFDIVQKEGKRRGNSLITGRGLA